MKIIIILGLLGLSILGADSFKNKNFLSEDGKYVCIEYGVLENGKPKYKNERAIYAIYANDLRRFDRLKIVVGVSGYAYTKTIDNNDSSKSDVYGGIFIGKGQIEDILYIKKLRFGENYNLLACWNTKKHKDSEIRARVYNKTK